MFWLFAYICFCGWWLSGVYVCFEISFRLGAHAQQIEVYRCVMRHSGVRPRVESFNSQRRAACCLWLDGWCLQQPIYNVLKGFVSVMILLIATQKNQSHYTPKALSVWRVCFLDRGDFSKVTTVLRRVRPILNRKGVACVSSMSEDFWRGGKRLRF